MAKPVLVDLDFGNSSKATGLPAPTLGSDAATKTYVDSVVGGLLIENIQTGATYTFVAADVDDMVSGSSASAKTFTLPLNAVTAIAVGSQIAVRNTGSGPLTVNITGAGILNAVTAGGFILLRGQETTLWKTATDTWEAIITPNRYAIPLVFSMGAFSP